MTIGDTLDNLIAVAVVVLILSLVVQSIQAAVKKFLKLKSKHIEESLLDLFQTVLNRPPESKPTGALAGIASAARSVRRTLGLRASWRAPVESLDPQVKELFTEVMRHFERIGRTDQWGYGALNSLAKEDLIKVLERVVPERLEPRFTNLFRAAAAAAEGVRTAVDAIDVAGLPDDASANFAQLKQELWPLIEGVKRIAAPNVEAGMPPAPGGAEPTAPAAPQGAPAAVAPTYLVEDVTRLPKYTIEKILTGLAKVQQDAHAAPALAPRLGGIAKAIGEFGQSLDQATDALRSRLNEVSTWYATVMQGFEERYDRSMKTWALGIGLAVVILLNANLFSIYRNVATNDATRSALVRYGEQRTSEILASRGAGGAATRPATSQPATQPAATPAQPSGPELFKAIQDDIQGAARQSQLLSEFGLKPLWESDHLWWRDRWAAHPRDALFHDIQVIIGWIVMACLLGLGAPFWHDALESLFGVKHLLQKKGAVQNVESASGAGKTKTGT